MRKVIDRKLYNTETAEPVSSWDNGNCCKQTLYITKNGTLFLHDGKDIRLMDQKQAVAWLEDKAKGMSTDE